jgi:hypothetical protein
VEESSPPYQRRGNNSHHDSGMHCLKND